MFRSGPMTINYNLWKRQALLVFKDSEVIPLHSKVWESLWVTMWFVPIVTLLGEDFYSFRMHKGAANNLIHVYDRTWIGSQVPSIPNGELFVSRCVCPSPTCSHLLLRNRGWHTWGGRRGQLSFSHTLPPLSKLTQIKRPGANSLSSPP